ncbi:MAG: FtsX-like permease family protein [Candidatus Heimdallarchaeota archaeon]|nr:FtsX-like permease family protein [Candidatus Heimdallarchaeota archaeon]
MLRFTIRFFFHNKKRTLQATMTLTLALVIYISTTLLVRGYAGNIAGMASIIKPSNYYLINESDMSLSESRVGSDVYEFLEAYSIDTPNVAVVLPQIYIPITVEGETGVRIDTHLRLLNFTNFELYQRHDYTYTLSQIESTEIIMGQHIANSLSSGVGANLKLESSEIYVNETFSIIYTNNLTVANIIKSGQEYDLEILGDINEWLPILGIDYYSFIEFKVLDTREIEQIKGDITEEFKYIEITEEQQTQNFIIYATEEVIRTLTLLQILFFVLMLVSISYSIYTLVKESEEEIFILRSIGATKTHIVGLFMLQAVLIGIISSILSIIIGYLAVSGIVAIVSSTIRLPFLALNFEINLVGIIFLFALGLSLLSGIYPSLTAAKIKVIREDTQ